MIYTINEYLELASSDNIEDNARTRNEELSFDVILGIINNYPREKSWLVHNKHIPIEILKMLATDEDDHVRFTVAMKKKCDRDTFKILMADSNFSVRMAIVRNNKFPIDLLEKMLDDEETEISSKAARILSDRRQKSK